jgi:hypothetical protein
MNELSGSIDMSYTTSSKSTSSRPFKRCSFGGNYNIVALCLGCSISEQAVHMLLYMGMHWGLCSL